MNLHQGDCIQLLPAAIGVCEPLDPAEAVAQLFQVISVDQHGNRCWLRRWPLARRGSPVFENESVSMGPRESWSLNAPLGGGPEPALFARGGIAAGG